MVLEIPPADDGLINGTIMDVWQVHWRMLAQLASTKARAEDISSYRPATKARCRTATLLCRRRITKVTRSCALF